MKKTLVLSVGNNLRHDDGIASVVLARIDRIMGIDYLDAGTDGLALIDIIKNYEKVFIIDAVEMKQAPATVKFFKPEEAKIQIQSDALSTHGFGLAEVLELMKSLNIKTDMHIIGIQPDDIDWGEGLSGVLENELPRVVLTINTYLLENN